MDKWDDSTDEADLHKISKATISNGTFCWEILDIKVEIVSCLFFFL